MRANDRGASPHNAVTYFALGASAFVIGLSSTRSLSEEVRHW
jgi:hypothetical protein